MNDSVTLTWSLSRAEGSGALLVTYQVENHGPEGVLVMDQMLQLGAKQGLDPAPQALIVTPDPVDPGLVHLTRGRVAPSSDPRVEILPGVRPLGPGETATGAAEISLPLRAWHPNDGFSALAVAPTRAVLEIGVLPLQAPTRTLQTSQGAVQVPERAAAITAQVLHRGEARAVP